MKELIHFITSPHPLLYQEAVQEMQTRVAAIAGNAAPEQVWLLEHLPVITAGRSSNPSDLLQHNIPIVETNRGGKHTYHGPGQRIVYLMVNLRERGKTLSDLLGFLERVAVNTLASFDVPAYFCKNNVGLWVGEGEMARKIAAIGLRVSKGVSSHGIAFNVNPDLSHFNNIVPCGIKEWGVTSLHELGVKVTMQQFDEILIKHLKQEVQAL